MTASKLVTEPTPELLAELAMLRAESAPLPLDELLADQRRRWQAGQPIGVEVYRFAFPPLHDDPSSTMQLIIAEWRLRQAVGNPLGLEEYRQRFPDLAETLTPQLWLTHVDHPATTPFVRPAPSDVTEPETIARLSQKGTKHDTSPMLVSESRSEHAQPGRPLAQFRLLRVLGEGGMGIVYEAEDTKLRVRRAVKLLRPHLAARSDCRKRFLREARAMARVEHERIIPIYEADEVAEGPYLVMPLLSGETLRDRLRRPPPLPPAEIFRLASQIVEGLAAAHAGDLVHRDIKPSNIWLKSNHDQPPQVILLDFGLARAANPEGTSLLSDPGTIMGTVGYMAPEQAMGEEIDHRADLFALGCVLFEMTTGHGPYHSTDTWASISRLMYDPPPRIERARVDLPERLIGLIHDLMHRDPNRRPASIQEVATRLQAAQVEPPGRATPNRRWWNWWRH